MVMVGFKLWYKFMLQYSISIKHDMNNYIEWVYVHLLYQLCFTWLFTQSYWIGSHITQLVTSSHRLLKEIAVNTITHNCNLQFKKTQSISLIILMPLQRSLPYKFLKSVQFNLLIWNLAL